MTGYPGFCLVTELARCWKNVGTVCAAHPSEKRLNIARDFVLIPFQPLKPIHLQINRDTGY